jgi:uncharacterized protein (DUF1800 family)
MDRRTAFKKGSQLLFGSAGYTSVDDGKPFTETETTLEKVNVSLTLEPYVPNSTIPWNRRRVLHLCRRMGFIPNPSTLATLEGMSPSQAVDYLIQQAQNAKKITEPSWANLGLPPLNASAAEIQAYNAQRAIWLADLRVILSSHLLESGLRGKLTMFWHNHFVTEISDYGNNPQYAWRYLNTIQEHHFSGFKALTLAMGLTPAMLVYLNGNQNQRVRPNENYARELLELFTLGEGNGYTQKDIEELARALTGYQVNGQDNSVSFVQTRFDSGSKTIFGKTGNYTYTTAHDLLFQERREAIARHVCRKAYHYFVYPNAPEMIVDEMASLFLESDMNLIPVLRALFKSRHFFDDELMGTMVLSPTELLGNYMTLLSTPKNTQEYRNYYNLTSQLGQILLQPPDVSGWKGHRSWINTSTLPTRWTLMEQQVARSIVQLLEFAKAMPNPNKPYDLARNIAEYLIAVPLKDEEYIELGKVLLGGSPDYEWRIDSNGAASRIQALVSHIVQMPEYQLN